MTPEEKFNQDVWWTLQAIKKELLLTPTGENVKINIARLTNRDANSPAIDNVSKCIRKLEEMGAFKVTDKYDPDSYDPYYGANPDWERATEFLLAINQPKFDEFYHKYEDSFKRDEEEELTPSSSYKNTFDWEKLSTENLNIAQKVIKITLGFLELQPINRLSLTTKIPIQKFENERVYLGDVSAVLDRIDGIRVTNTELLNDLKECQQSKTRGNSPYSSAHICELHGILPSEEELKSYVFLQISALDELRRVKSLIYEQLKIDIEKESVAPPKQKNNTIAILIKDIRLDEQNYLLEINKGEKILSFKSKKQIKKLDDDLTREEREILEKETLKTKQWKILSHLWEFRRELKGGNVLENGDFTSLGNLAKVSGSESTGAAYKQIQRLNKRFEKEGVAIEIKGENEKYRLIINKA